MSVYDNVVGGKLKLKGKALDVKAGGVKKKKKHGYHYEKASRVTEDDPSAALKNDLADGLDETDKSANEEQRRPHDDHLTPSERRYIEQRMRIDTKRLAKTSDKSHRDRIEEFNQYLANMSEHYDIPKVGPG